MLTVFAKFSMKQYVWDFEDCMLKNFKGDVQKCTVNLKQIYTIIRA